MSSSQAVDQGYLSRFREVSPPDRCQDWAARLQIVCEDFWTSLNHDNQPNSEVLKTFIQLLHDEDSFMLARLVIPELRDPAATTQSAVKQYILDQVIGISEKIRGLMAVDQASFDTSLYREEKTIMAEVDLHRAKMLFLDKTDLTIEEEQSFRRWWDSCPLRSPKSKPVPQDD